MTSRANGQRWGVCKEDGHLTSGEGNEEEYGAHVLVGLQTWGADMRELLSGAFHSLLYLARSSAETW